jgi:hypothetical protein
MMVGSEGGTYGYSSTLQENLDEQMSGAVTLLSLCILMLLLHCHIGAKTSARLAVWALPSKKE